MYLTEAHDGRIFCICGKDLGIDGKLLQSDCQGISLQGYQAKTVIVHPFQHLSFTEYGKGVLPP